jgi:TP53 regulating kinase-like protein
MTSKILAQGAEAIITLDKDVVTKDRIPKSYRLKELDEKIRESRTRKEAKTLEKASKIISVPKVLKQTKYSLELEYIDGDKLSQTLNTYTEKKQFEVMQILGEETAKLHDQDIIHGDLTTSNTILKENTVYIIDFGLSFISHRIEDKAVDLHLIKQALEAKHFQNHEQLFEHFKKGYEKDYKDATKVLEQLKKVEMRGRHKH